MEKCWSHNTWGEFKFQEGAYVGSIPLPEFNKFSLKNLVPGDGKYELAMRADDETLLPIEKHVEMIERLITNQKEIAMKIPAALWADFHGVGPYSGMWWHGSIEEVMEDLEDKELKNENDIYSLMNLSKIWLREEFSTFNQPIIELAFNASFEVEHGVGILTDANTIIGTGYIVSASPYKSA